MKLFILSGSHRKNSQSLKVSRFLEKRIKSMDPKPEVDLLSLEGNPIPLWDEGLWEDDPKWKEIWTPVAKRLEEADALVVVTPEWGGMATPGVKNFLLMCSGGPIAHKAGLLVSVSGSRNGAYPVAELRMTASKNNQICWIPEHIIVRDVESVLEGDTPSGEDDKYLRGRIDYSLTLLQAYAGALGAVRESGVLRPKEYPFGM